VACFPLRQLEANSLDMNANSVRIEAFRFAGTMQAVGTMNLCSGYEMDDASTTATTLHV